MADTRNIIIAEQMFEVRTPYAEGHVLTAAEAKQLNQVRCENVANNFRKRVKEAIEKGEDLNNIRAELAEYDSKYDFTAATGGTSAPRLNPVEREARAIARAAIKQHLASQGRKITDIPEGLTQEEWDEKLEAAISATALKDEVVKSAKKRIAEKKKIVESALPGLSIN